MPAFMIKQSSTITMPPWTDRATAANCYAIGSDGQQLTEIAETAKKRLSGKPIL
jgi:hypothetical protein